MKKYLIFFSLFLSACSFIPTQEELVSKRTLEPSFAEERVQDNWWLLYHNEDLNRLAHLALTQNTDYLKTIFATDKSLYQLRIVANALFPTPSASLGASAQRNISTHDHFTKTFSGGLNINYEVDLYGKIRDSYLAQKAEYHASQQEERAAKLLLVHTIGDAYFNLMYIQNALILSQKNLASYKEIFSIVSKKYQQGKSSELEMHQTEQSLLTEKNKLLELQAQEKEIELNIKNILNIPQQENLNLKHLDLLTQKTPAPDLNIPLDVIENRPDVQSARLRLQKAFKNASLQEKNWYPNVSLSSSLHGSADKAKNTFDVPFLMGSIQIDLPFLDWNRVYSNIKIAQDDYEIALLSFKDTLNQAVNEIAYYVYMYQQTQKIFKNTEQNYQNAIKITTYYQKRYQYGKIELKDYLDAIRTKNILHQELIRQKYQLIRYENSIYKALGGVSK